VVAGRLTQVNLVVKPVADVYTCTLCSKNAHFFISLKFLQMLSDFRDIWHAVY